ncbi:MAG TPA: hypothetical protein VF941_11965 [Clostridia bacterium]
MTTQKSPLQKYHPLPGFLVLEQLEEQKIGYVSVSDDMSAKDSAGIVVAVGDPFTFYEGNQNVMVKSPVKVGDKVIYKNIVGQRYLDFETGKHVFFVKFHFDPVYSDIMTVIKD